MTSTAAATAKVLADAGIERVFGLPGGEVLVLMDELRRAGVDFVLMRHEANAGIAAAVYGKLRGQPGVVLTTLGPGAANLMLPMCSAYLDQEPLLAISAQIPDEFPASHTHQLLPLHDAYRPIARYVDKITGANVVRRRAARAGAVHGAAVRRVVPHAVRSRGAEAGSGRDGARAVQVRGRQAQGSPPSDARDAGGRRSRPRSRSAKRPLVVIGLGIDPANAARIRRWVTDWNLPVAVTPKVKGIVDETAANFVGVVGGMAADGVMCDAIAAADLRRRLRPRSGGDRQDVARGAADSLGARIAERRRHRAAGRRARRSRGAARRAASSERPPATWPAPFKEFQEQRAADAERPAGRQPGTMWPGDIVQALAVGDAAGDDRHDRRRLAQVPVRPVLAEPRSRKRSGCRTGCRGWRTG